ncbi:MAG: ornithine cyclodeaminase family protein [Gemmatimonadota bacterium]|nr:ornithine cyclodeaminase family protein [Gemmatimonadota bacterium]
MPLVVELDRIKEAVKGIEVIQDIEDGFVAYSQGKVQVPPVGELIFEDPPGDVHIKYGAINGDDYYVIKLASGFADNPLLGIPRIQGMMLIFSQKTGEPIAFLLDQGYLTNVRTAAAGAVAAKYMAPKNVNRIGVFGTGVQGRMQIEYLKGIVDCTDIIAWGRSEGSMSSYKSDMEAQGYSVETTTDPGAVAAASNFIVMSTPSKEPLLQAGQIKPGTHITAMGSDTPDKIELDPAILANADVIVVDSIPQSASRGEIARATEAGAITPDRVIELGNVIADPSLGRTSDDQTTITDLTGVAVQDIQISKAVYHAVK